VCSGCRIHEEKDQLDWNARGKLLETILNGYKNTSGHNYDCIIPVSGARDSYFIVHTIKNVYGMNPLLVSYNKQYNTDVGIRNLARLRIEFNCDIMTLTVNPETVKKITRATIRRMGSIYWHCIAGQTVYPVQMAVKFKIPLIIWGAHQGIDQVGMYSHLDEVEMTRKYRKEHDLMGFEADDLIDDFDNISEHDVRPFQYPDDKELERVGVRGIYLNNFIRWDTKAQHEAMIRQYGFEPARQTRTFDTYNDVDCFNYSDVHDYIKLLKHGYGKVTDHSCREIRLKRLTREDAVKMVKKYQCVPPENLQEFLDWLGITKSAFEFLIDHHRNKTLWHRDEDWVWRNSQNAFEDVLPDANLLEKSRLAKTDSCVFQLPPGKRPDYKDDHYILVGKGYYNS
jgi:N-acetyl sugar amidotransferase